MATIDVTVTRAISASPANVRAAMFDPRNDPRWMAAVRSVEPLDEQVQPGTRARRVGRFLGRTLRWTTEVLSVSPEHLELRIVDGPMRGIVTYHIEPAGGGAHVSIRNTGEAPGFAPRWLLGWAMRRALTADLARLQRIVEGDT